MNAFQYLLRTGPYQSTFSRLIRAWTRLRPLSVLPLFALTILVRPADAAGTLKLGVLPIEDVVPFYLAAQDGHFDRAGVTVELVPFLSALERDSALTAGAIDGAIDDPVGAILLDQGRGVLRITSIGLGETPAEGVFAILSAPASPIRFVADLRDVPIAVSSATIIDYVTDRLLTEQGLPADAIRTIDVRKMPIRMQMLLSGAVQAATLPEPLASIARTNGAHVIITDAQAAASLSQTVIVFRTPVLTERRLEIAAFFRGYAEAVTTLNAAPERFRDLFVKTGRIPPELAKQYPLPTYPLPRPFARELYEPVMAWLAARNLAPRLAYEAMVDTDFLGTAGR